MALVSSSALVRRAGQAWWMLRSGIVECTPPALKAALDSDPRSISVHWQGRQLPPLIDTGRGLQPADFALFKRLASRSLGLASVVVVVPLRECLVRELTYPTATLARLDQLLRLDLETSLPFRCSDLFHGWYVKERDTAAGVSIVAHIMIKKNLLAPLITDLAIAGLPVRRITMEDDGARLPVNLLDRSQQRRAVAIRSSRAVLAATLGLAGLLALSAFGVTYSNLQDNLAVIESELQNSSREAQAARKMAGDAERSAAQLRQARLRKRELVPVTEIWEEITRILPDDTWLAEIRIEDGKVRVDGQSANASRLIGALAQSPIFTGVAFASPVTRDQRGFERFQIQLATAVAR